MNELKYLIVKQSGMNDKGRRAIVFNGLINHSSMLPRGFKLCSAGFCTIKDGNVTTKGRSESLDCDSHEDDADIIKSTLSQILPTFGIWEDQEQ